MSVTLATTVLAAFAKFRERVRRRSYARSAESLPGGSPLRSSRLCGFMGAPGLVAVQPRSGHPSLIDQSRVWLLGRSRFLL